MFVRFLSSSRCTRFRRFCTVSKILNAGPQPTPFTFQGWILHRREHKDHNFYAITDGLSPKTIQVVLEKSRATPEMKPGAAVSLTGNFIPSRGRGQLYDFIPEKVEIIGEMDSESYPIGGKERREEGEYRPHLHLRPRLMSFAATLRLRNFAKNWLHQYMLEHNFLCIDTPILTLNDCEGGGEAFYVEPADKVKFGDDNVVQEVGLDGLAQDVQRYFFRRPAYMTVSAQLHLEAAACAFRQVYSFNPVFRAESSMSRRHLAEFYMFEVEMAFVKELDPLLELVEDIFRKCSSAIISENEADYNFCSNYHNASHMAVVKRTLASDKPFHRLQYKEAVDIVEKGAADFLFPRPVKGLFTKEQELYLVKHCGNMPIFVLNFPADAKPFYMARSKDDPDAAACFDLLVPLTGELVGGSLREGNYATLESRLAILDIREKMEWYLELRKYGYPRTGGFGVGFERYLQWLMGVRNIKDCLPFPRWYHHCYL